MQLTAKAKINKLLFKIHMKYIIRDNFQEPHNRQTYSIKMEVNLISLTIFNKTKKSVKKYKKKLSLQIWRIWIYQKCQKINQKALLQKDS